MLIDFNQPDDLLIAQFCLLQSQLEKLSNQSILESPDMRDNFLSECLLLLKNLDIDAIFGGFYLSKNGCFKLDAQLNIYLAEFLLSAGKTFFNGELTEAALQILNVTCEQLFIKQKGVFARFLEIDALSLPFLIDAKILLTELEQSEQDLLLGLLNREEFSSAQPVQISYRASLKDAAQTAAMPLKQAQIVANTIQLKLQRLQKKQFEKGSISNEYDISINAKALSLLTEPGLITETETYKNVITALRLYLIEQLKTRQSTTKILTLCEGLLNAMQYQFDEKVLQLVAEQLAVLKISSNLSAAGQNQTIFQNQYIFCIQATQKLLPYLPSCDRAIEQSIEKQYQTLPQQPYKIIILNRGVLENTREKSKRLASFMPHQRIFPIN